MPISRRGSPLPPPDEWQIAIDVQGRPIDCLVRRSFRARRLRLTVDRRKGAIVTVPARGVRTRRGAESLARAFVAEREEWLGGHLRRQETRLVAIAALGGLRDGATLHFRGEPHRLRVVATSGLRRSQVIRCGAEDGDEIEIRLAQADRRAIPTLLEAWLRERARIAIVREIERHAGELAVVPQTITIRDQRTRWGSCSRAGRLSFSWRLILAPPEALETVVVHELAHLRVFGHGPAFWSLVAQRVPNHRRWRRWLRDHSLELHHALSDGA